MHWQFLLGILNCFNRDALKWRDQKWTLPLFWLIHPFFYGRLLAVGFPGFRPKVVSRALRELRKGSLGSMARKRLAHTVMLRHQVWKTVKCQCQEGAWNSEEWRVEGITWYAGPVTLQVECGQRKCGYSQATESHRAGKEPRTRRLSSKTQSEALGSSYSWIQDLNASSFGVILEHSQPLLFTCRRGNQYCPSYKIGVPSQSDNVEKRKAHHGAWHGRHAQCLVTALVAAIVITVPVPWLDQTWSICLSITMPFPLKEKWCGF